MKILSNKAYEAKEKNFQNALNAALAGIKIIGTSGKKIKDLETENAKLKKENEKALATLDKIGMLHTKKMQLMMENALLHRKVNDMESKLKYSEEVIANLRESLFSETAEL
jgi:hypothetical protein